MASMAVGPAGGAGPLRVNLYGRGRLRVAQGFGNGSEVGPVLGLVRGADKEGRAGGTAVGWGGVGRGMVRGW